MAFYKCQAKMAFYVCPIFSAENFRVDNAIHNGVYFVQARQSHTERIDRMTTLFSERLKAHRKASKKTQEQMAQLLFVRRSTYGEYERGKIIPPIDKIKILADYFEISVDYLMGNTNIKSHRERGENGSYDVLEGILVVLDYLQDKSSLITFDGNSMSAHSRQLLIASIETSVEMTKLLTSRE